MATEVQMVAYHFLVKRAGIACELIRALQAMHWTSWFITDHALWVSKNYCKGLDWSIDTWDRWLHNSKWWRVHVNAVPIKHLRHYGLHRKEENLLDKPLSSSNKRFSSSSSWPKWPLAVTCTSRPVRQCDTVPLAPLGLWFQSPEAFKCYLLWQM